MKIDVKWIIFLLLVVMSMGTFIYATAQIPDYLIYNNAKFALTVNPLEPYLKKNDIRPRDYFPKNDKNSVTSSTACWRGYVAIFEISADRLYLKEIEECHGDRKADLKRMFKEKFKKGRVFADWYSGNLRCPKGKMTRYVHMGYMSEYERELAFEVENGEVLAVDEYENHPREVPPGYQLTGLLSFEAVLLDTLKPCDPEKISSQKDDQFCLMSENQSLRIKGKSWMGKDRLYGQERFEWIKKELAAVKQEKELFYSFGDLKLSKSRWGYMGWIEGENKEGDSRVFLFAMSNINSRLKLIFSAKQVPENNFQEMLKLFTNSIKLIEFGY